MIRACVLSGGGVKGAFQVGALSQVIRDKSWVVDKWFGTSTGALTSAIMSQGDNLVAQLNYHALLEKVYLNIKGNKDIYDGPSNNLSTGLALLAMQFSNRQALYDPKGLRNLLKKYFDHNKVLNRDSLAVGVVDFEYRNSQVIQAFKNPFIYDYILASASMPIYFPPVEISGRKFVDGGVRDQTLLGPAVRWLRAQPSSSPKELVVILTAPLTDKTTPSNINKFLDKLGTTISIMTNEIYLNDLKEIMDKNILATRGDPRYTFIPVRLIYPTVHYDYTLEFEPSFIAQMLRDGVNAPIHEVEFPLELQILT